MTTLFQSGYEFADFPGDFTSTVGDCSLSTTVYHHGAKSGEYVSDADEANYAYKTISAQTEVYHASYYMFDKLPNDGKYILLGTIGNNSNQGLRCRIQNDSGTYKLYLDEWDGSPVYGSATISPSVDTWHFIEIHFEKAASASVQAWFGDSLVVDETENTSGSDDITTLRFGIVYTAMGGQYPVTVHNDCVTCADTGPIGPEAEVTANVWGCNTAALQAAGLI